MSAPTNEVYPGRVVARAREHFKAEWGVEEIRRLLEREFGRRPSWHTVKGWVDPRFAERRRTIIRKTNRAYRLRRDGRRPVRQVSDEWKLARMRELRDRDLSFLAIAQVAAVWWGDELTDEAVSRVLGATDARRAYRKAGKAAA